MKTIKELLQEQERNDLLQTLKSKVSQKEGALNHAKNLDEEIGEIVKKLNQQS